MEENINTAHQEKKGKLKIFFGYAAGVGKTYAMLEAAHNLKKLGHDVVAGYIEPHAREETQRLVNGLEQIPVKQISYKGVTLNEFNIDLALKRKPEIILVDELAHTNAPSSRNLKRYQDIQELLRAGINVYTTVNVQHIESLNDKVASITGIHVSERVPDYVFDSAEQVEVVDIEPHELLERLKAGKIYRQTQAKKAMDNFFIAKNLVALREIALRRTADQLNMAVKANDLEPAKTNEHILTCLSSSPSNAKVIRTASTIAKAFNGSFTALFVQSSDFSEISEDNLKRLKSNIKLAEQLGARIVTVYGDQIPLQISEYAKISGVSKIVLGRSTSRKGLLLRKKTFVDQLTELSNDVDIYVIPDRTSSSAGKGLLPKIRFLFSLSDVLCTVGMLAICTLIGFLFTYFGIQDSNIITTYILGVLVLSLITHGHFYSGLASLLSVVLYNFCFIQPIFTLNFHANYGITFFITFLSAFISSSLATTVKNQAKLSAIKANRTEVLLETSRKLHKAEGCNEIIDVTAVQLRKLLNRTILFYTIDKNNILSEPLVFPQPVDFDASIYQTTTEKAVADWVLKNNKNAGASTNTLPNAKCFYLAVRGHSKPLAVCAVAIDCLSELDSFEKNLLLGVLDECGIALEKELLREQK